MIITNYNVFVGNYYVVMYQFYQLYDNKLDRIIETISVHMNTIATIMEAALLILLQDVTCILLIVNLDLLSIEVKPNKHTVGERGTVQFTAMATGKNVDNFRYQWRKRDSDSLPSKVSGVTGTVLTIPNLNKTDEGRYYCTVTNEWGRRVVSNDVILTVEGTYV